MRLHAAKRQTEDFGNLLIGLSARRPKQTLLFPDRQLNRNGRQFEIDIRSRINKNRQQLEPSHIACLVDFPVVICEVAGEGNERDHPAPIPERNGKTVAPDAMIQGVGEECFRRRVVKRQSCPVEWLNGSSPVRNYRIISDIFLDEVTMLPQPRIGDDSEQQTDISALVGRQAQICNVAKTNRRQNVNIAPRRRKVAPDRIARRSEPAASPKRTQALSRPEREPSSRFPPRRGRPSADARRYRKDRRSSWSRRFVGARQ